MDGIVGETVHLLIRWVHVVAGVIWIGHLYFFNWVNAHLAKTYDADSKKKVVPELMPRALYWFRWGAAYTWISGFLLAGIVYYMGSGMMSDPTEPKGKNIGIAFVLSIIVAPALYDTLWKRVFATKEQVGVIVSFVLMSVLAWYLDFMLPGRAAFIHIGMMFGTIMAMNVWMRIWPLQRKIIGAIKGGTAADAAWASTAGLRSKHNTYLSVPLILLMVSNHYPLVYGYAPGGTDLGYAWLIILVAIGWGATKMLYTMSGKNEATTKI
jgi:uncharacterized membrane protein